ncbi:hypothetical protein L1987_11217 [Smallanthus sonchifolius]|uniref:Uncharacterized protein n=1 Tax=Smallanthus sonchifolius TaxID=185202 RepID=A0ACB9JBA2_9ASTR|nr:hypothetical protein L1987_11217 [Smallanthus sonchifolius]
MAIVRVNSSSLTPFISSRTRLPCCNFIFSSPSAVNSASVFCTKIIDSHLHVWASPEENFSILRSIERDKYPYVPGQEPSLRGNLDFLLHCMEEAGVDGALIVQPINHKFDHSYVTSVLKKHPSKFVGCCLANPAEDGSGVQQLEHLILEDGYRAVRFNPYLWPSGQQMTNEIGKAMFSKAGELGVPVGFMCMKGLNLHISEIQKLCSEFPKTVVLLDHLAFCKPPILINKNVFVGRPRDDEEAKTFSELLALSRFPQLPVSSSSFPFSHQIPKPAIPSPRSSPTAVQAAAIMEDVMKNSPAATEGLLYDKVLCYEVNLSLPIWILPVIYRFVTELMVVYRVWG